MRMVQGCVWCHRFECCALGGPGKMMTQRLYSQQARQAQTQCDNVQYYVCVGFTVNNIDTHAPLHIRHSSFHLTCRVDLTS
mmetsp:Transcript_8073/g.25808  ORF Transcript_8073/g.25808 Transcript_8073/m.25808 type:complete len:81 (-) Transcript_8073:26-268(-)